MAKIKHVPQLIQTECGLCCIVMLNRYYGNNIDINDLRDYVKPGRDGVGFSTLCDILKWQKYECKSYKGPIEVLESIKEPLIVYWEKKHFIILEKVKGGIYYVVDPALGYVKYTKEEFAKGYSEYFIYAVPGNSFEKNTKKQSIWISYLQYVKNCKQALLGILGLSILTYFFTILFNTFIQELIDSIDQFDYKLIWIVLGTIMGYTLVVLLNALTKVFFNTRLFSDFSKTVYEHLINVDYSYFENRSYGNLSFSLECISMVKNLYAEKMVNFIVSAGAVMVLMVYLCRYSVMITVAIAVLMVGIGILLKALSSKVLTLNQLEIAGLTKLQEIQTEFIYSILNIKIAGIEDKVYKQWEKQFDYTNEKTKRRDLYQSYYNTAATLVQTVLPLFVLFVSIMSMETLGLTIGQVVATYSIVTLVSTYMVNIYTTMNYFALSEQYLERVSDITNQKVEENGTEMIGMIDSIKLENLSFQYNPNAPYVLKDISLEIRQGQKVAFVGTSGSGKSTLAKLILGLYKPTTGNLYYNGIDISDIDHESIRKQCGMVPQDNTLFNKSILENITMGREDITMEQVIEACTIAEILDEINEMPMKFNTIISDMGMNISGGQRQRIVLARAIVNQPNLLIFDEATSSLDSVNERQIYSNIYSKNCTRIIIAHRLTTIADADYIYVLKDGEIVEQGTHEELFQLNGEYSRLYQNSKY